VQLYFTQSARTHRAQRTPHIAPFDAHAYRAVRRTSRTRTADRAAVAAAAAAVAVALVSVANVTACAAVLAHRASREGSEGSMPVKRGKVRSHKPRGARGRAPQLSRSHGVRRAREQPGEYGEAPRFGGHAHLNLRVEAPGAAQRRIECLRPVGRTEHEHRLGTRDDAVHLNEELREQTAVRLAAAAGRGVARGADRVDFVQKEHRGRTPPRLVKGTREGVLSVAVD
jgi:hypothetical protein